MASIIVLAPPFYFFFISHSECFHLSYPPAQRFSLTFKRRCSDLGSTPSSHLLVQRLPSLVVLYNTTRLVTRTVCTPHTQLTVQSSFLTVSLSVGLSLRVIPQLTLPSSSTSLASYPSCSLRHLYLHPFFVLLSHVFPTTASTTQLSISQLKCPFFYTESHTALSASPPPGRGPFPADPLLL